MKKIVVLASVLILGFSCQNEDKNVDGEATSKELAAAAHRGCASEEVLQRQLNEDPGLAQRMKDIEIKTAEMISQGRIVNGVMEIPVVFNVLYRTSAENISTAQLQSQIDVLNKDFNALNSDFNQVPTTFSVVFTVRNWKLYVVK